MGGVDIGVVPVLLPVAIDEVLNEGYVGIDLESRLREEHALHQLGIVLDDLTRVEGRGGADHPLVTPLLEVPQHFDRLVAVADDVDRGRPVSGEQIRGVLLPAGLVDVNASHDGAAHGLLEDEPERWLDAPSLG